MGVYKRKGSRFYWMSYTVKGSQIRESTKSTIKDTAKKIWHQREVEVARGRFNIGWSGERMGFDQLAQEYERSHVKLLSKSSQRSYGSYAKHLKGFFAGRKVSQIDAAMIEQYRDLRRQQPAKTKPGQLVKGATINRELEVLQGMLDWAARHKYIPDNPAVGVEHFNENRERPEKKPVTAETFLRILSHAPLHLRVGMVLLEQTGNRTYSELFSLGKSQVDLDARLIRFVDTLKTPLGRPPRPR